MYLRSSATDSHLPTEIALIDKFPVGKPVIVAEQLAALHVVKDVGNTAQVLFDQCIYQSDHVQDSPLQIHFQIDSANTVNIV